jgi:hypothetical protein
MEGGNGWDFLVQGVGTSGDAVVNTIMNLWVPAEMGNYLPSGVTISFARAFCPVYLFGYLYLILLSSGPAQVLTELIE